MSTVSRVIGPDGYRYYEVAGRLVPSVTSVLHVLDKPGLDTWRLRQVRAEYSQAVARVTTFNMASTAPDVPAGLISGVAFRERLSSALLEFREEASAVPTAADPRHRHPRGHRVALPPPHGRGFRSGARGAECGPSCRGRLAGVGHRSRVDACVRRAGGVVAHARLCGNR